MKPLIQSKNEFVLPVLIALTLGCFGISPAVRAVSPPPDGGYPNFNTAEGEDALFSVTTGNNNTAVGFHALFGDLTGKSNTAVGSNALAANDLGSLNTAVGFNALAANNRGDSNTAVGWLALQRNTSGLANTAAGANALANNTFGDANAAIGHSALFKNSTGLRNTAIGVESLKRHSNGSDNIALGYEAGMNLTAGNNNILIGTPGVASESNQTRIGTPGLHTGIFIAGISGVTVPNGDVVVVDSSGHLGTNTSSARYKEAIKPMGQASAAIHELRPVTFRYKEELDQKGIPQFGLVAEEVAKVDPDLVARDEEGKPYTVRYEAVNAMLLNEFLKEHHRVEELEKEIADLTATVKEQATQIQKVSAQVDATARLATNQ